MRGRHGATLLACAVAALGVALVLSATVSPDGGEPAHSFVRIVGQPLPQGVAAIGHDTAITDNLLHRSHFWRLSGDTQALHAFAARLGMARSDDDARFLCATAFEVLPVAAFTPEDTGPDGGMRLLAGYEGEGGRDPWLCIAPGGREAVYWHED